MWIDRRIPGVLDCIEDGSADDCVNTLAGGGTSLKESHDQIRKIAECLNEEGLASIRHARVAAEQMWPQLEARGQVQIWRLMREELRETVGGRDLLRVPAEDQGNSGQDPDRLSQDFTEKPMPIGVEQFEQAVEKIKGRPEWERGARVHACSQCSVRWHHAVAPSLNLPDSDAGVRRMQATVSQMESDMAALGGLFAQVVAQIQKLTTPADVKIERVRVADFFSGSMESEDQVKQAVARLQDHLLKLLDEGVKIVVE